MSVEYDETAEAQGNKSVMERYQKLLGRSPSDSEIQRLCRLQKIFRLRGDDSIWLLWWAAEYYVRLYERFPTRIEKSAAKTLENFQNAANASAAASAKKIEETLTAKVLEQVDKVAASVARRRAWQWVGVGLGIGALLCAVAFWFGFEQGRGRGYDRAQAELADVKMAAAWGNSEAGKEARRLASVRGIEWLASPEGQRAFQFSRYGDLRAVMNCDHEGWTTEVGSNGAGLYCVPGPDRTGRAFWQLR